MQTPELVYETKAGPIKLAIPEGVMAPSAYSLILADNVPDMSLWGVSSLDLGSGSGIIAIVAAKRGAHMVLACDNSPAAVDATAYNARLNGVENQIQVLPAGDMFEPLEGRKVDAILCNPAQLPMAPREDLPGAYSAGERGRTMLEDLIIIGGRSHLNPSGGILFTQTSIIHPFKTWSDLWDEGYQVELIAETELPFRDFYDKSWIEQMEDEWITDAIKKFQGLNELFNYMERRYLAEGLFRKDQDGTYYEKVMVIQAAKARFERSRRSRKRQSPTPLGVGE